MMPAEMEVLPLSRTAERTSAVHFLRFELTAPQCDAVKAGAPVVVGCDHAHLAAQLQLPDSTRTSLAADLA